MSVALLALTACRSGGGGSKSAATTSTTATTATTATTMASATSSSTSTTATTSATATTTVRTTTTVTAGTTAGELTVRGVVSDVSASARVIRIDPPVNGVANLALTGDTEIVRSGAGGAPGTISDVHMGATVEATGRPSAPDTLVVRRLVLL